MIIDRYVKGHMISAGDYWPVWDEHLFRRHRRIASTYRDDDFVMVVLENGTALKVRADGDYWISRLRTR